MSLIDELVAEACLSERKRLVEAVRAELLQFSRQKFHETDDVYKERARVEELRRTLEMRANQATRRRLLLPEYGRIENPLVTREDIARMLKSVEKSYEQLLDEAQKILALAKKTEGGKT